MLDLLTKVETTAGFFETQCRLSCDVQTDIHVADAYVAL